MKNLAMMETKWQTNIVFAFLKIKKINSTFLDTKIHIY